MKWYSAALAAAISLSLAAAGCGGGGTDPAVDGSSQDATNPDPNRDSDYGCAPDVVEKQLSGDPLDPSDDVAVANRFLASAKGDTSWVSRCRLEQSDAGNQPSDDAGTPPDDGGVTPPDSGTPPDDAGTECPDASPFYDGIEASCKGQPPCTLVLDRSDCTWACVFPNGRPFERAPLEAIRAWCVP